MQAKKYRALIADDHEIVSIAYRLLLENAGIEVVDIVSTGRQAVDAALKLDIVVWQKLYRIIFRRVKKYLNVNGNTLEDLVSILSFIWNCEGNIHDIFQAGDNQFTISIIECPYIDAMKRNPERHDRMESICTDMCVQYLQPVINEFNPKIEITRDKFMGL